MAASIAGVGRVTVSLRKSIMCENPVCGEKTARVRIAKPSMTVARHAALAWKAAPLLTAEPVILPFCARFCHWCGAA
jgi:hypothetical protein